MSGHVLPLFDWFVYVRLDRVQNEMCYVEVGLCAQIYTKSKLILGSLTICMLRKLMSSLLKARQSSL